MWTYSGRCPVCGEAMVVTRLQCRSCDTTLEGTFELNRFARLGTEQVSFLETFIRCQGKLSWVGDELGLSYPTVRSRLTDVIRALGFEVLEEPPAEQRQRSIQQRQTVLDDLAKGTITAEQAIELLQGED
jgi:hypothetical protein